MCNWFVVVFGVSVGNEVSDEWDFMIVVYGKISDVPRGFSHHSE